MDKVTWLYSPDGIFGRIAAFSEHVLGLNPIALLFAVLTPTLLIYGRHEVRIRRLRAIKDFIRAFDDLEDGGATVVAVAAPLPPPAAQVAPPADPLLPPGNQVPPLDNPVPPVPALADQGAVVANPVVPPPPVAVVVAPPVAEAAGKSTIRRNPSFEFVKSKYISDIDPKLLRGQTAFDDMSESQQIDHIIESVRRFGSPADKRLFVATIGLILVCYYGFDALQATVLCGLGTGGAAATTACAATNEIGSYPQLLIIGSLAFIGAYIAAIRIFLRGLAVFDLSSFTFLRQTAEIVASVAITILLFRAFPDPFYQLTKTIEGLPSLPEKGQIPWIWYALAPLLGILPQSSTKFLLVKLQSFFTWIKTTDDRFLDVTRINSLDIIDGIDYETRFRLEECGIFDVQNLAAYNPIMLHIESPYNIYQVIDWIAQAQLCHIVGPEKFLLFRELNIRTIFDLERAISDSDSPAEFDEICFSILFISTSNMRNIARISDAKFLVVGDDNVAKEVDIESYMKWIRERVAKANVSMAAEQVMRWIADDLHVRRLRRLWKEISNSLGESAKRLEDTKP